MTVFPLIYRQCLTTMGLFWVVLSMMLPIHGAAANINSAVANIDDCTWPQGMTFMGLVDDQWHTYAVLNAGKPPEVIALNTEARAPVLSMDQPTLYYMDDAAQVSAYDIQNKQSRVLLKPSSDASYTQIALDNLADNLYVVQLKQGNSVDTDILWLNTETGATQPVIIQRSAQFEPHLSGDWLYYGNVHCVLGCGKIIQEIWRYHRASGQAEQLTLLNQISRQPVADADNQWFYFSSNAAGHYHIYRQSLSSVISPAKSHDKKAEALTEGVVTDSSPALFGQSLYFIRQQAQPSPAAKLMCRNAQGELHTMPQDKEISGLRDLTISSIKDNNSHEK